MERHGTAQRTDGATAIRAYAPKTSSQLHLNTYTELPYLFDSKLSKPKMSSTPKNGSAEADGDGDADADGRPA